MHESVPKSTHWPTYALRAWMTALLGQMQRAGDDLDTRIEALEKELARLRGQKERSKLVVISLRDAVAAVDNVLRETRDSELQHEQERGRARPEPAKETKK